MIIASWVLVIELLCSAGWARAAQLNRFWILVPSMEGRQGARVPSLTESRTAQIPVRTDLARHGAQVVPEVDGGRPAPEPIAVIDAVDDESRLEHEWMGSEAQTSELP